LIIRGRIAPPTPAGLHSGFARGMQEAVDKFLRRIWDDQHESCTHVIWVRLWWQGAALLFVPLIIPLGHRANPRYRAEIRASLLVLQQPNEPPRKVTQESVELTVTFLAA
jgi:hypothetical protein